MLKSFLVLDPNYDPTKKIYTLNKQTIYLKQPQSRSINFSQIYFKTQDICHSILYDIVISVAQCKYSLMATIFNGNNQIQQIMILLQNISQMKLFQNKQMTLKHFSIKKNQLYDYNRFKRNKDKQQEQQLDEFDRINLENTIKIKQLEQIQQELISIKINNLTLRRQLTYNIQQKKKKLRFSNQFLILNIDGLLKLVILNLTNQKYNYLTNNQFQQLQKYLILSKSQPKQQINYLTSICKILSSITQSKNNHNCKNYLISYYPQDKLILPQNINKKQSYQIINQIQNQKDQKISQQIACLQKRVKQLQAKKKFQLQYIQNIMIKNVNIYQRQRTLFDKIADSLAYLNKNTITNIPKHIKWLQSQISIKKKLIDQQQSNLANLQRQYFNQSQNHQYFISKLTNIRNKLLTKVDRKTLSSQSNENQVINQKSINNKDRISYLTSLSSNKYQSQNNQTIYNSQQKRQFYKLLNLVKDKVSYQQFKQIQERFNDLIG